MDPLGSRCQGSRCRPSDSAPTLVNLYVASSLLSLGDFLFHHASHSLHSGTMAELRILPGKILLHHCPPDYAVAHVTYKLVASRTQSTGLRSFLSSVGRFLGIIAPRPHIL